MEKGETQIVGSEIWRNTEKKGKMRNAHCRTWNMIRKLKNLENET
jgi:hypothetical protein